MRLSNLSRRCVLTSVNVSGLCRPFFRIVSISPEATCVCIKRNISHKSFNDGIRTTPFESPKVNVNHSSSSLPQHAAVEKDSSYLGVVRISSKNISQEMETKVPFFLYFMVENHTEVKTFTKLLCNQVDQTNRRLKDSNMGECYQEFGKDMGLAIKLGMVNCLEEPGLMQKFGVDPHMFPLIYFVFRKMHCDKLAGIVPEAQVKEAIEAFIDYAKEEAKNEKEGKSIYQKVQRTDNDDENAMTLLGSAIKCLQKKELQKATELYTKSMEISMKEIEIVNKKYGVGRKKMTAEMWASLKREACYNSAPQAMCGLAMIYAAQNETEKALKMVERVREEFPFAVQDLRTVSEAVVRVEILHLSGYDMKKDSYLSLLKYDELIDSPVTFYKNRVKLVVAYVLDGYNAQAIEECLRIIRSERKLLPALKEGGFFPRDFALGPKAETPARKIILKIFESLGSTNEHVIKGRKLLQLYL
ncbi:unnamed protein product [Phytomonas sp. EM1]|nr:unnamed protein product [Phytomonas sp. EM1]|eukprot:CCW60188.1 unnamed protein product [Phytomonas sp. isolate EM1]